MKIKKPETKTRKWQHMLKKGYIVISSFKKSIRSLKLELLSPIIPPFVSETISNASFFPQQPFTTRHSLHLKTFQGKIQNPLKIFLLYNFLISFVFLAKIIRKSGYRGKQYFWFFWISKTSFNDRTLETKLLIQPFNFLGNLHSPILSQT